MNQKITRTEFRESMDRRLSAMKAEPWLAQRIIAAEGGEKTVAKKEEPIVEATESKSVDNMSVEELANMFIQNDTQSIEHLKEENAQQPLGEQAQEPEQEKENVLEKIFDEVVSEYPKETSHTKKTAKTDSEQPKQNEKENTEPQKPTQTAKQTNTNRNVYGYDHFGIIYGY